MATITAPSSFFQAATAADVAWQLAAGDYTSTDLALLQAAAPDSFVLDDANLAHWLAREESLEGAEASSN